MRKVQNEMPLLPDVSFFPLVPSSGGGTASWQPHHLCRDLRSAPFLTSFCRDEVKSMSLQGGGGEGKKAGGGGSSCCILKGRWLETEVLGRGSVGWVIMKAIVHGSVSL